VRLLALTGVATVLVTRAYLALTGYPRVGGGHLHIAHVLWGGLLMLGGLLAALLLDGGAARVCTALLGGVGFGLFVDEVGKFVTRTDDYFWQPAVAVIYLAFAGLLVLSARVSRRRPVDPADQLAAAARIAATGLASGLTPDQRAVIDRLLAERDDESASAVRRLAAAAPDRQPSFVLSRPRRFGRAVTANLARLARRPLCAGVVLALFVVSRVALMVVFLLPVLLLASGQQLGAGASPTSVVVAGITRTIEAGLALAGAVCWRRDRTAAYRWFRAAVLLNLLVTQVFAAVDSQFGVLGELPFQLMVLALVGWRRTAGEQPTAAGSPRRDARSGAQSGFRDWSRPAIAARAAAMTTGSAQPRA
jgi:hypothetical protein